MNEWYEYQCKGTAEARPYIPGEDLTGISVGAQDTPEEGGMIFRNKTDYNDQWYVAPAWFEANYMTTPRGTIPG